MNPSAFVSDVADQVVGTMLSSEVRTDGPVVWLRVGDVDVVVGVVDLDPESFDADGLPTWCHPEALFYGWRELVEGFTRAADRDRNGRPTLRLLLPAAVILSGFRPHDRPHQPFRSDWVVGAAGVDHSVRVLWNHGRELVELASPSVVVGGGAVAMPNAVRGARAVRGVLRWCHRRNLCIGFGALDVGVWALSGVRTVDRLKHAGDPSSPLREVVELVAETLGVEHET